MAPHGRYVAAHTADRPPSVEPAALAGRFDGRWLNRRRLNRRRPSGWPAKSSRARPVIGTAHAVIGRPVTAWPSTRSPSTGRHRPTDTASRVPGYGERSTVASSISPAHRAGSTAPPHRHRLTDTGPRAPLHGRQLNPTGPPRRANDTASPATAIGRQLAGPGSWTSAHAPSTDHLLGSAPRTTSRGTAPRAHLPATAPRATSGPLTHGPPPGPHLPGTAAPPPPTHRHAPPANFTPPCPEPADRGRLKSPKGGAIDFDVESIPPARVHTGTRRGDSLNFRLRPGSTELECGSQASSGWWHSGIFRVKRDRFGRHAGARETRAVAGVCPATGSPCPTASGSGGRRCHS